MTALRRTLFRDGPRASKYLFGIWRKKVRSLSTFFPFTSISGGGLATTSGYEHHGVESPPAFNGVSEHRSTARRLLLSRQLVFYCGRSGLKRAAASMAGRRNHRSHPKGVENGARDDSEAAATGVARGEVAAGPSSGIPHSPPATGLRPCNPPQRPEDDPGHSFAPPRRRARVGHSAGEVTWRSAGCECDFTDVESPPARQDVL